VANKKVLVPFYQVRRWFRLFKPSVAKRGVNELKISKQVTEEQKQTAIDMMVKLGLN